MRFQNGVPWCNMPRVGVSAPTGSRLPKTNHQKEEVFVLRMSVKLRLLLSAAVSVGPNSQEEQVSMVRRCLSLHQQQPMMTTGAGLGASTVQGGSCRRTASLSGKDECRRASLERKLGPVVGRANHTIGRRLQISQPRPPLIMSGLLSKSCIKKRPPLDSLLLSSSLCLLA